MSSQQKMRKEIKRLFKKLKPFGFEYVSIEYKSHGGHGVLHFTKDGFKHNRIISLNKKPTEICKFIKSDLLKERYQNG